jgi:hypothetical protein
MEKLIKYFVICLLLFSTYTMYELHKMAHRNSLYRVYVDFTLISSSMVSKQFMHKLLHDQHLLNKYLLKLFMLTRFKNHKQKQELKTQKWSQMKKLSIIKLLMS